MNVSFKTFLPAVTAGLLTLSACSDVNKRAEKYLANKPYSDYEIVYNTKNYALAQSKLDSIAYRDIFNGTEAAKDSNLVKEFNKIAKSTRGYDENVGYSADAEKSILKSIAKQGITTKEYKEIQNKPSFSDGSTRIATITQHYADDWAYRNFFKKAKIMNNRIAEKCDEVSKQIKP